MATRAQHPGRSLTHRAPSALSPLSLTCSLSLLAACPQIATQLNRPSIRVVHMEAGVTADNVRSQLKGGLASAVLLDSKGGGTGKTFDWEVGGEVQQKVPFILAGGLTPENVSDAVRLCLLYTSPSPRDRQKSRMPSSA